MRKHHLRKPHIQSNRTIDYILIGVIVAVAAVLRLWKLGHVPFMHDEFSALLRTRFDNLHDFIQQGIMPDSHPLGVQLFLWGWVKIFGWSEFWVKLPFALMGIGSVYLIYLIGRQWFNRKVGLFSAAFFAVSQFGVFYSQLARPYAAGLFFILLMAFFWHKIVFEAKKPTMGVYVGFALSTWVCSLIQYFSIAQAGLMFITGLLFLPKVRRKAYWISGLVAVLLFSPTLPIFYQQLFVSGSIGGWLIAPDGMFWLDFLRYTMNYSQLFIFAVIVIILLPILLNRRDKSKNPLRWVGLAWFLIIYLIAFGYSLLREPILQRSTLIFSYPFLVIVAFSLFKNHTLSPWQNAMVVAVILFTGATSLVLNRQHYNLMYHQGFDQIAVEMQHDKDKFGDQIQFVTRTEIGESAEFYQAQTNVGNRIVFDRYSNLGALHDWLSEHHDAQLLGFGWTDYINPTWEATAVGNYPYKLKQKDWFTSRYITLSKVPMKDAEYALTTLCDTSYQYNEGQEWGKSFTFSCDSLPADVEALGIVVNFHCEQEISNLKCVIELHDATTDSIVLWHSSLTDDGHFTAGDRIIADAIVFDDNLSPKGKTVKTYLWNEGKNALVLNKESYYFTRKNPVLTGLYEPLN